MSYKKSIEIGIYNREIAKNKNYTQRISSQFSDIENKSSRNTFRQQLEKSLEDILAVEDCSVEFIESAQPFLNTFSEDHCYSKKIEEPVPDIQIASVNPPEKRKVPDCARQLVIKQCTQHEGMFELKDDALHKPGDELASLEDFVNYNNSHIKRWLFYYKCLSSNHTRHKFEFGCNYKNQIRSKSKGIRKRVEKDPSKCPCKVILRRLKADDPLTVVYVCNHHDHELSADKFYKLSHIKRLPPEIKEEMLDLAALEIDTVVLRKYISSISGFNLKHNDIYNFVIRMKNNGTERKFSSEKIKLLLKKIKELNELYGKPPPKNPAVNPSPEQKAGNKRQAEPAYEALDKLAESSRIKKIPKTVTHDANMAQNELISEYKPPRKKSSKKRSKEAPKEVNTKSRLEICLENLSYDREVLQSVNQLQQSFRCETQINPSAPHVYHSYGNLINMQSSKEAHITTADMAYDQDSQSINYQNSNISENYYNYIENNEANNYVITNNNYENNIPVEKNLMTLENLQENFIMKDISKFYDGHINNNNETYVNHGVSEVNSDPVSLCDTQENITIIKEPIKLGHEKSMIEEKKKTETSNSNSLFTASIASYIEQFDLATSDISTFNNDDTRSEVDNSISTERHIETSENADDHKDEYIHKYNIDQYMVTDKMIGCIKKLANTLSMNALEMLKNVYIGKAVLKKRTIKQDDHNNYFQLSYITKNLQIAFRAIDKNIQLNSLEHYKSVASMYFKTIMMYKKKISESITKIASLKYKLTRAENDCRNLQIQNQNLTELNSNYKTQIEQLTKTLNKERHLRKLKMQNCYCNEWNRHGNIPETNNLKQTHLTEINSNYKTRIEELTNMIDKEGESWKKRIQMIRKKFNAIKESNLTGNKTQTRKLNIQKKILKELNFKYKTRIEELTNMIDKERELWKINTQIIIKSGIVDNESNPPANKIRTKTDVNKILPTQTPKENILNNLHKSKELKKCTSKERDICRRQMHNISENGSGNKESSQSPYGIMVEKRIVIPSTQNQINLDSNLNETNVQNKQKYIVVMRNKNATSTQSKYPEHQKLLTRVSIHVENKMVSRTPRLQKETF